MSRLARLAPVLLAASTLLAAACSAAYSEGRAAPPAALAAGELAPSASPYGVEIIAGNGATLETFLHGGRYYVLGAQGDRYQIRITNPTDRRVEAVVTVDGLDVIDGQDGDLRKRGYVVPPRGELRIEGFRTSTAEVATFRFSSVGASYAGRKGKARNVGVIAVALFEEQAAAELILDQRPPPPPVPYHGRGGELDDGGGREEVARGGSGGARGAAAGDAAGAPAPTSARPPADPAPVRQTTRTHGGGGADKKADECCANRRPGLGTEYGEQRYSAATWTRFVRASDVPVAVAELRYNDAAGLAALGIPVAPAPDHAELTRRETADPFPGDPRFSRPPAGVR